MTAKSTYTQCLRQHPGLSERQEEAGKRLNDVREAFANRADIYNNYDAFVFCAGSLARGEIGAQSDLDLFLVTTRPEEETESLIEIRLQSSAIEINELLEFEPFSNDGQFLKVYSLDEMLRVVGAPYDDSENLFTARMLLLLESKCILGEQLYNDALSRTITHYFRDSSGKQSFRPLFLLNDLLRYWRTLCLNYEQIRSDQSRPWRKKNINLKFSRKLTVFGAILPILVEQMHSADCIFDLVRLTPLERLSRGLDALNDSGMLKDYTQFLDDYESFLSWKDVDGTTEQIPAEELGKVSREAARRFSDFIYSALMHNGVKSDMKKYLVL